MFLIQDKLRLGGAGVAAEGEAGTVIRQRLTELSSHPIGLAFDKEKERQAPREFTAQVGVDDVPPGEEPGWRLSGRSTRSGNHSPA
jgi:hypothetical protein